MLLPLKMSSVKGSYIKGTCPKDQYPIYLSTFHGENNISDTSSTSISMSVKFIIIYLTFVLIDQSIFANPVGFVLVPEKIKHDGSSLPRTTETGKSDRRIM